jgi:hypothetical protein
MGLTRTSKEYWAATERSRKLQPPKLENDIKFTGGKKEEVLY